MQHAATYTAPARISASRLDHVKSAAALKELNVLSRNDGVRAALAYLASVDLGDAGGDLTDTFAAIGDWMTLAHFNGEQNCIAADRVFDAAEKFRNDVEAIWWGA